MTTTTAIRLPNNQSTAGDRPPCNHLDAKAWIHEQSAGETIARCPGCRKFQGYVMPPKASKSNKK